MAVSLQVIPSRINTIPANLYQLQRIMKKETATRITVMILGLFIMSLGIAFSTKAGLGTTPISCVPYVLSQGFPLSFGTFTFFMNSLFVVFQYFLLKDRFEPYQWLQIPLIFVFSVFTNLSMLLVDDLIITGYVFQWIFCLVSCILVAFGIALLLKANALLTGCMDSSVPPVSNLRKERRQQHSLLRVLPTKRITLLQLNI